MTLSGGNVAPRLRTDDMRLGAPFMIVLGVILLLIGWLVDLGLLVTIGTIVLVIGLVLFVLGAVGRPVGGRRFYW
ncbi:hypothetical protein [Phytoactinopolyspora halotolerans]|uniref:Uncharacterized protein n=1 Tax=Phytoactinopolyspora halotolerans TaxID=1981512 RepID=A0A6L9S0L1_9ACTN|nr:hypothetical protein [Phytoactinopolyspora halotolerans]NED98652.1 hypothetical protein [Phytoactinopolyspora halotolerans]